MTGKCKRCGRNTIDPGMLTIRRSLNHKFSYEKELELEERKRSGLCAVCFKNTARKEERMMRSLKKTRERLEKEERKEVR